MKPLFTSHLYYVATVTILSLPLLTHWLPEHFAKKHILALFDILRLDKAQISSNPLKKAFAT